VVLWQFDLHASAQDRNHVINLCRMFVPKNSLLRSALIDEKHAERHRHFINETGKQVGETDAIHDSRGVFQDSDAHEKLGLKGSKTKPFGTSSVQDLFHERRMYAAAADSG
jgi:hypothetical protein